MHPRDGISLGGKNINLNAGYRFNIGDMLGSQVMGTLGGVSIEGREVNIDTTSQSEYGFMTALNMVEYLVNSTTGGMALTDEKKERAQTANYIQFAQQNLQGLVQAFKKWFSLNAQRKFFKQQILEQREAEKAWRDAHARGDSTMAAKYDRLVDQARFRDIDLLLDEILADENNEANKSPHPRVVGAIDLAAEAQAKVNREGIPDWMARGFEEIDQDIGIAHEIATKRDNAVDNNPHVIAAENEAIGDWTTRGTATAALFADSDKFDPVASPLSRAFVLIAEEYASYQADRHNYSPDAVDPSASLIDAAAKARMLSRVSVAATGVAESDGNVVAANRATADASARLFAAIESGDNDAARAAAAEFSRLAHEAAVLSGYTDPLPPLTKHYDLVAGAGSADIVSLSAAHVAAIADALVAQLNAPPAGDGAPAAPPAPGGGAAPGAPPAPDGGGGVPGGGVVPPPPPGGT
jgi:hypothetical protein